MHVELLRTEASFYGLVGERRTGFFEPRTQDSLARLYQIFTFLVSPFLWRAKLSRGLPIGTNICYCVERLTQLVGRRGSYAVSLV